MTAAPDSRTEVTRRIVRQAFEAWRDGRAPITDMFAPDMTWRIEGHSLASKAYRDRQEFIDQVLEPFGARFSTTAPFRPVTVRAVHADGDTAIVLWDGRGTTTDDQTYENSYAWFMTLRGDKVVDGTAFYDSISFNDLWTRVQPRR
jgi:ketosteroid isomerase-like protein